ncbi:MAG: hypothetical protein MUP45_00495 [Candidatus Marinimicrobia bacterium]|nr:hypothetical protein [Candidatus Neomarinimicrobiota bacterium]
MRKKLLKLKNVLIQTNYILFCVFASLYLILLGLETYQGGFNTYYFNFNLFLVPIFITALILAFTKGNKNEREI